MANTPNTTAKATSKARAKVEPETVVAPEPIIKISDTKAEVDDLRKTRMEMTVITAEANRKKLVHTYTNEERVNVSIPSLYAPYFGRVMNVSIKGISIWLPINGKTFKIPKTYAAEVRGRLARIDRILAKGKAMADIPNNHETAPGLLKLW